MGMGGIDHTHLSSQDSILKHKIEIKDGCVKVPDGPGFGVELDEQYFEKVIIK
jgi:L-alanine-DL-glutamate epimerase-like enolase superfamily enzyme